MSVPSESSVHSISETDSSPFAALPELEPIMPGAMHSNDRDAESKLDANIRSLFDRSVSHVQTYSSRIQQAYVKPAYEHAQAFSEVYPVLSLYIGIFSVLSLLPVVVFLLASTLVLSASVFLALSLSLVFSASVICVFGLFLFGTLLSLSLLSIASTALILGAYLLVRLIAHMREQPTWRGGVKQWTSELQMFIRARLPERRQEGDAHASITEVNGVGITDEDAHIEKLPVPVDQRGEDPIVKKEARENEVLVVMED